MKTLFITISSISVLLLQPQRFVSEIIFCHIISLIMAWDDEGNIIMPSLQVVLLVYYTHVFYHTATMMIYSETTLSCMIEKSKLFGLAPVVAFMQIRVGKSYE